MAWSELGPAGQPAGVCCRFPFAHGKKGKPLVPNLCKEPAGDAGGTARATPTEGVALPGRAAAGPQTLAGSCEDPEGVRAWSGSESASPRPRTTSPRLSTTQKRLRASMMVSPALHGPTHHLPLPRCAWRHHPAGVRPWRSSGHESPSARRMLGAWPPRPSRSAPALHLARRHTRCRQLQSPVSANASRPLGTATMDI